MPNPLEKKTNPVTSLQESQSLHWTIRQDAAGYARLAGRLKRMIGVDMPASEKNRTLMACRLGPVMKRLNCRTYAEYERLLEKPYPQVVTEFISTLTTHTTDFYREPAHFRVIPQVMHQLESRQAGRPELRVWCAAASTGQEPYTMLFSILQSGMRRGAGQMKFLASDIDRAALIRASNGTYSLAHMSKVPQSDREKFFDPSGSAADPHFTVKPAFRKMITFAEFNLATPTFPFQYPFDIIFCRNVLIYFDHESGCKLVDKLARALAPGGFLFLGHSETGFVRNRRLRSVAAAVFQKVGQ